MSDKRSTRNLSSMELVMTDPTQADPAGGGLPWMSVVAAGVGAGSHRVGPPFFPDAVEPDFVPTPLFADRDRPVSLHRVLRRQPLP